MREKEETRVKGRVQMEPGLSAYLYPQMRKSHEKIVNKEAPQSALGANVVYRLD